jgi:CubicO group peptidase (beta-lactamase class C family)
LIRDVEEQVLRNKRFPGGVAPDYSQDTIPWPFGDVLPDTSSGIDVSALAAITNKVINENAYKGNIYAFLVLHKGIPVAEAYKPPFNRSTRFLSWSMAKSFVNALTGILVREGKIDISQPAGIEEWKNDERSKITMNDLMQMQSGLKWNEDYGNRSDVTLMLHCESDMGRYAFDQPYKYPAGSKWAYSSGTTNIVSYLIRKKFDNDSIYQSFVRKELFNRIGTPDAVFEPDASGTIVGSSYLYATARDFARFGLLYMKDGVFNGNRILPEGWVKYSTTEAKASNGSYGSFFWLNKGKTFASAPDDMFSCNGHDGQFIFMIPSRDLVIVILGYSPSSKGGIDLDRLLGDILRTVGNNNR